MNTFTFIFALAIAQGIAAHSSANSENSTGSSNNAETIKTKRGDVIKTIQSDEFTCQTGGTVTFTIGDSFDYEYPVLFPVIDASVKAEIYAVDTVGSLKKLKEDWTHENYYVVAKESEIFKKIQNIKKFIYFGVDFNNKQFLAEVLLPKTDKAKKGYTSFKVKVQSKCPLVPKQEEVKNESTKVIKAEVQEIPAVDVTKTFIFENSAARYIPGLAIAAVSVLGYFMN